MPYDDWNEALIDRGWEQMKQLLEEHQPRRRYLPGWLLWAGLGLFLLALPASERFLRQESALPVAAKASHRTPPARSSETTLTPNPENRPGAMAAAASAATGRPRTVVPRSRKVVEKLPLSGPVPRMTGRALLRAEQVPSLPVWDADLLAAAPENLTAPPLPGGHPSRWGIYAGGGFSTSLHHAVDGGWAHLRLQYALGRRWYLAGALEYQSTAYRMRGEEEVLQDLRAGLDESMAETTMDPAAVLPSRRDARLNRLGLPIVLGYRLSPTFSLEAGGQIALLWPERSRGDDSESVSNSFLSLKADQPLHSDLQRWEPSLTAGMRWSFRRGVSLHASWQQGLTDIVPGEVYRARTGTLRLGLELKL